MVIWFRSIKDPKYIMYVGDDKYENETILKYSFPEDIWFHVDTLSSAHVYLRPPMGTTMEEIPKDIIMECAAITKDRSIQGRKRGCCSIIYTPASNVKKHPGDAVGTVYCKVESLVKSISVDREATKELVKQLEKTFVHQKDPDLAKQREDREREVASWRAAKERQNVTQ
eukprot:gnl/Chilomastix_caulleri/1936.p1 GENE.gnl/Chilomastix_caulleri/1936~~gnl/Chilomastix_caulleri/1936.p1  ORF type:complete len:181 (-),score=33.27 gnl/Chilomastix_caulleri/1936:133-642(-)